MNINELLGLFGLGVFVLVYVVRNMRISVGNIRVSVGNVRVMFTDSMPQALPTDSGRELRQTKRRTR